MLRVEAIDSLWRGQALIEKVLVYCVIAFSIGTGLNCSLSL